MDDFTSLTYEIKKSDDGTRVIFTGEVDETADFSQLTGLSGQVTFDLEEIERFNSEGIRRWVKFIRELEVSELILEKCSVPVVTQLNLIRGLKGQVWVKSFYIPYVCIASGEEELHLLHADDIDDPTNPPTPEGENGALELDDLPERYFSFLKDFVKP